MKYRSMTCALILLALIACTNPVAPSSKNLAPTTPYPHSSLPGWQP